jgi:V8-like Glu-specific endopeptidase
MSWPRRHALRDRLALLGLVSCAAVLGSACSAAVQRDEHVGAQAWPIVYGMDDRIESFEGDDPALIAIAQRNTVAIMTDDVLSIGASHVGINAPNLGESHGLCADQRFADQPSGAICSGLLLDAHTLLTASHCVRGLTCERMRFLRGYYYHSEGALEPLTPSDIYRCKSVLTQQLSATASAERVDYALVELDRAVTGRLEAIEFRPRAEALSAGEPVTLVGFPGGVPLKLDRGGVVTDPRQATLDYFITNSDSFHGSSGSPVFDAADRLIGIQGRGDDDYMPSADGCNVVAQVSDDPALAHEQATYAFRAHEGLCDAQPDAALCCTQPKGCKDQPDATARGCSASSSGSAPGPIWSVWLLAPWAVIRGLRRRPARTSHSCQVDRKAQ